ncbi:MAG: hypothetical protein D3924_04440 [Candidatus Electrothrix sp. AR4]|nr:hypothetical protein [Candidatus Electrothrix sp. AR4]
MKFQILSHRLTFFRARQGVASVIAFLLIAGQLMAPLRSYGFSIGEERIIGEQLLLAVRSEFDLLDDPDIVQYINGLGQQVLEVAGPQYFDYHFFVVRNDQFNAFAAPSGLIFFNTGLIKTMKSEEQLLSVLAHEVGHVVSRHISNRIAKQEKVTAASMLFGLASLAVGNPALIQGLFTGALAANRTVGLNFSRQDEEQADRLAFDWLLSMGRDPYSMEAMLKSMRRITRYRSEQLPPYLLTHPNPEDRLHYVQSLLEVESEVTYRTGRTPVDNFAFHRFKYRVLSKAMEPEELRIYCANILVSNKSPDALAMAHYGLALLSAEETDFKEAVRQLEIVRQEYPDREILHVDLAALYVASGELDKALQLLLQSYQRDPTDMYCAFELARAMAAKGRPDMAEKFYLEVERPYLNIHNSTMSLAG